MIIPQPVTACAIDPCACAPPIQLNERKRIYIKLKLNGNFFHYNVVGIIENIAIKMLSNTGTPTYVKYVHTISYGHWAASTNSLCPDLTVLNFSQL